MLCLQCPLPPLGYMKRLSFRKTLKPHLSHCIFLSFSHYLFCVSSWPSCPSEMPQAARNFSLKVPKATGASDQKYIGFFPTPFPLDSFPITSILDRSLEKIPRTTHKFRNTAHLGHLPTRSMRAHKRPSEFSHKKSTVF